MHKAIGFITCVSVMAVSLYLFSGGDPSRTLSAQTDSDRGQTNPAEAGATVDAGWTRSSASPAEDSGNPFADSATETPADQPDPIPQGPVTSNDLLKKRQAQRLITEARKAMAAGNIPLARSRAMQAR